CRRFRSARGLCDRDDRARTFGGIAYFRWPVSAVDLHAKICDSRSAARSLRYLAMSIRSAAWKCRFSLLMLLVSAPGALSAQDLPDPTRFESEIQRFEAQDK